MENSDFSARLNELLGDPEMMGKVMSAARSVMGAVGTAAAADPAGKDGMDSGADDPRAEAGPARPAEERRTETQGRTAVHDADRVRLLRALCPFLNETRREAAESLVRVMSVMQVLRAGEAAAERGGN